MIYMYQLFFYFLVPLGSTGEDAILKLLMLTEMFKVHMMQSCINMGNFFFLMFFLHFLHNAHLLNFTMNPVSSIALPNIIICLWLGYNLYICQRIRNVQHDSLAREGQKVSCLVNWLQFLKPAACYFQTSIFSHFYVQPHHWHND